MKATRIGGKLRLVRRLPAAMGLFVASATLAGAFGADEGQPPQPAPPPDDLTVQFIDLDPIAPEVTGSSVTVYLTGRAPKLPEETVIEARLILYSAEVDKATIKLDGTRRFTKFPFRVGPKVVFGDGYCLQLVVAMADQTPAVQEKLRALAPRIFTGPMSQWSWIYFDRPFRIGTEENEAAQFKETQAFFKELLLQSIKLNNEFAAAASEASEGKRYATPGGKFDSAAWRKWLDGTWRKAVLNLQRGLQKWGEANGALVGRHGEGVAAAWSLLETVARRSFLESRELYRSKKLEVHENDVNVPEELVGLRIGLVRGTASPRVLRRLREDLAGYYDKVIDSFRLDLPKVRKAAPASKETPAEPPPPEKEGEKKG